MHPQKTEAKKRPRRLYDSNNNKNKVKEKHQDIEGIVSNLHKNLTFAEFHWTSWVLFLSDLLYLLSFFFSYCCFLFVFVLWVRFFYTNLFLPFLSTQVIYKNIFWSIFSRWKRSTRRDRSSNKRNRKNVCILIRIFRCFANARLTVTVRCRFDHCKYRFINH